MPIPTQHDRALAEIDDLHGIVLIRLRAARHTGARDSAAGVLEALNTYVDAVIALLQDQR